MKTSIPPVSRRSFLGLSTLGAAAVAVGAAGCANNSSNAGSTGSVSSDKASIVFRNGTIQTMVKEGDTAAALAVSGNKIVYVGEDSGVDEYIDDNTRVIDLDGGMVTPRLYGRPYPRSGQLGDRAVRDRSYQEHHDR